MKNKLLRHLRETAMLAPGDTVTCALSGGADSVCMTHALSSLQEALGITVRACHFNHRLRGAESDGDEQFCRALCEQLAIELTVGSADVAAYAKAHGESIEEAARHCRYAFFEAQEGLIATAHNADDQLETVLLNLVRGTGLKGLCGIPPVRGRLIRPMLPFSRAEILAYLTENGLSYREDSTNATDDCLRNRLRHGVVPLLKAENPALLSGVAHLTDTLREDEVLLEEAARKALVPCASGYAVAPLKDAPKPIRRRAIRMLLRAAPKITAAHVEGVEALLFSSDPSANADLPGGLRARREYDTLVLDRTEDGSFSPVTLPCPGEVTIAETGATVRCGEDGDGLKLPKRLLDGGITVRPRKSGDSIRLNAGTQTLKKLMIDRKIPALRRGTIPVFEKDGKVLAVWGIGEDLNCLPSPGEPTFTITVTEKEASL